MCQVTTESGGDLFLGELAHAFAVLAQSLAGFFVALGTAFYLLVSQAILADFNFIAVTENMSIDLTFVNPGTVRALQVLF